MASVLRGERRNEHLKKLILTAFNGKGKGKGKEKESRTSLESNHTPPFHSTAEHHGLQRIHIGKESGSDARDSFK